MSQSVVERLLQTNPSMEVWWDSSPLVFDPWVKKMVSSAPPEKRAEAGSASEATVRCH